MRDPTADLPSLAGRLALRPREAATALGISERKLRELAPELPRIVRKGVVLYPVRALEQALDRLATTDRATPAPIGDDEASRIAREELAKLRQ